MLWAAGDFRPRRFLLGPASQDEAREWRGTGVSSLAGVVRLGFTENGPLPAIRFFSSFRLPDNGNVVGPIDLPAIVPMELPCEVTIWPESQLDQGQAAAVVLTAVDDSSWYGRFQATHTILLPDEAPLSVLLPLWVTGASLVDNAAVAHWRDAADAANLGNFAGNANPRTRLAHYIRGNAGGEYAILHYGL